MHFVITSTIEQSLTTIDQDLFPLVNFSLNGLRKYKKQGQTGKPELEADEGRLGHLVQQEPHTHPPKSNTHVQQLDLSMREPKDKDEENPQKTKRSQKTQNTRKREKGIFFI